MLGYFYCSDNRVFVRLSKILVTDNRGSDNGGSDNRGSDKRGSDNRGSDNRGYTFLDSCGSI